MCKICPQNCSSLLNPKANSQTIEANADDGANGANGLQYCTAALKLFLRRAALSGASRLENLRVHRCFLADCVFESVPICVSCLSFSTFRQINLCYVMLCYFQLSYLLLLACASVITCKAFGKQLYVFDFTRTSIAKQNIAQRILSSKWYSYFRCFPANAHNTIQRLLSCQLQMNFHYRPGLKRVTSKLLNIVSLFLSFESPTCNASKYFRYSIKKIMENNLT